MKKIPLVVAVVAVLAIAQTGAVFARGGDQQDRGNQRRGAAVNETGQNRNRGRVGERRRDSAMSGRQERQARFADRVDSRQAKQRARIREGRKSGTLTRGESRRLRRDQKKISRLERRFERDGRFTKRERRILNKAQNRAGKRIFRAKNNNRDRGYRGSWGGRKHQGHRSYRGWQRHSHHDHFQPHVEEQVAYVPSASSSLAMDLQFEGFSVGLSRSTQF